MTPTSHRAIRASEKANWCKARSAGLTDIGKPNPGDIVVVSGAAGAAGSVAVHRQGAWLQGDWHRGLRRECRWVVEQALADVAFD